MNKSKTQKEIADWGLTEMEFVEARAAYTAAGLNLARVPHRGWRVYGLHKTKPVTFVLWSGLEVLVGNHVEIIGRFLKISAEV